MSEQPAPTASKRRDPRCTDEIGDLASHVASLPEMAAPTAGPLPTIDGLASAQGPSLDTPSM